LFHRPLLRFVAVHKALPQNRAWSGKKILANSALPSCEYRLLIRRTLGTRQLPLRQRAFRESPLPRRILRHFLPWPQDEEAANER
jgi:hypothetical protein